MIRKHKWLLSLMTMSAPLFALPIGFGVNQGSLIYHQLQTPSSVIYHDARTPNEARMVGNTLAGGRPLLETWLGVMQNGAVPVITSAVTDGASFANFITAAIELQTMGQGTRDLFWHEYVHHMMYEHFHNFLGPAGAVVHLPWIPAWFIEGLAESLSVSVGSDWQSSIERYQALSGDWPTYDRLHSLYSSGNFALRGYATSGAFVSWLLRKQSSPQVLAEFLTKLYGYTWPQYYPLSINPFGEFMPMDEALRDFWGQSGRELYAQYQAEARAHWEAHPRGFRLSTEQTKISTEQTPTHKNPELLRLNIKTSPHWQTGLPQYRLVQNSQTLVEYRGQIMALYESRDRVLWVENDTEHSRLCGFPKSKLAQSAIPESDIQCFLERTLPQTLLALGDTKQDGFTREIWLGVSEQTLVGERNQLLAWNADTQLSRELPEFPQAFTPQAFASSSLSSDTQLWLLVSEHGQRTLWEITETGRCRGRVLVSEIISSLAPSQKKGGLRVTYWAADKYFPAEVSPGELTQQAPCSEAVPPTSPLMFALQQPKAPTLPEALHGASTWETPKFADIQKSQEARQQALPLNQSADTQLSESADTQLFWKARPIFAVPWMGADDALGSQVGMLSVPLMDFTQNETLRLTLLYGTASHYPNSQVSLISTRFWPTLELNLFRRQLYNGLGRTQRGSLANSYLDEQGASFESTWTMYFSLFTWQNSLGLLSSHRQRYLGPERVIVGAVNELFVGTSLAAQMGKLGWNLGVAGRNAPPALNTTYRYDKLEAFLGMGYPLGVLDSRVNLRLEGARTRGKRNRSSMLREYYTPQRTFLAGSGGGYNQNSYTLLGEGTLFTPRFGDNKVKGEVKWQLPIVKDISKQLWLFYFEELLFSAFWNRGGAWYQGQDWRSRLVTSHGYAVDLFLENKGVRFNTGLGIGQVFGEDYQIYATAGFDALF